jgi:alkanesulfonate monooxygenase SsuD/methylene tetrahydromethanopterin reductase-like flavin-dependent oxidoreductase (luciferase family)
MLDQLSRRRFDLGVGRGISPIETAYFGVDPDHRQKMYIEALQILRQVTERTLTSWPVLRLCRRADGRAVPYAAVLGRRRHSEGGETAGRNGFNLVANAPRRRCARSPTAIGRRERRIMANTSSGWPVSSSWAKPTRRR